jgi:Thioredoxin-like [2Fe-2S] ferredoxin
MPVAKVPLLFHIYLLVNCGKAHVQTSPSTSTRSSAFVRYHFALRVRSSEDVDVSASGTDIDPIFAGQEKKFKIVTCMSTSCSQKRKALGLDNLATFGSMYSRAESTNVQVEEGRCLGSCKMAPCVGIEHGDFVGSVSLEGMTDEEFSSRAYVLGKHSTDSFLH